MITRDQPRTVTRNPLRMMGSSTHRQEAAARPTESAASGSQIQWAGSWRGNAASASAMTGQCHR